MSLVKNKTTPENRKFWEGVERTAEHVRQHPEIYGKTEPAPASPEVLEPSFPIGKCKHCGKDVPDAKRNGRTILFCSYKCYCEG